tara:strand:- start:7 stop:579 length:573 start_codon:yes stop_codon:yes gene_type:complete
MVKKDKVKKPLKKRVKKVVKQTQTQKQTVVVNIDTKKAPIRRRRAPTPRQQEPSGIARFIRMNEPPQMLMNTGAMGMNVREPLKNIGDYSQMGLGEKTNAQRQQEMLDNNMKFLDKMERDSRKDPFDLGRETESDRSTTLPEKVTRGRGRPRVEKTEEQKEEERRRRLQNQRERRQRKKDEKEREKKQNM